MSNVMLFFSCPTTHIAFSQHLKSVYGKNTSIYVSSTLYTILPSHSIMRLLLPKMVLWPDGMGTEMVSCIWKRLREPEKSAQIMGFSLLRKLRAVCALKNCP